MENKTNEPDETKKLLTTTTDKERKQIADVFKGMRDMAQLKALSKVSLERPLTDEEHKKIMELKKEVLE